MDEAKTACEAGPSGGQWRRKRNGKARQRMNMKRMRRGPRHGGGGGGGGGQFRPTGGGSNSGNQPLNRNHSFDSSGPDVRLRGTAQQLFEKYLQLGRDATSAGDRVAAEGYFQHAEHYFRILGAMNVAQQAQMAQQERRYQQHGGGNGNEQQQPYPQGDGGQGYNGSQDDGDDPNQLEAELAGEAETLPMPQSRQPAPQPDEPTSER
jgi:hypothetical protein